MKNIIKVIFFCILAFCSFAEDIKIIELHNQSIDQILLDATKNDSNSINTEELENPDSIINESNSINTEELENPDSIINESNSINEDQENVNDIEEDSSNEKENNSSEVEDNSNLAEENLNEAVIAVPDFWEKANKDELLFLFDNAFPAKPSVLTNFLIDSLVLNSSSPKNFTEDEFNHLKIINLVKLEQRKKAFDLINKVNTDSDYKDFYNTIKLNYFFSSYELSRACDFVNSINRKESTINENFLLKVDIFCSFIQDRVDEANFLNSLLEDLNDTDQYFQKIYLNLKNLDKNQIDITHYNYDENAMPLYSAMIRVGEIPLNHKFLLSDPLNYSIPIILSGSSDIALRLKAAHEAYKQGIFNAESLSALYQTVDFSYDELTNTEFVNFNKKMEVGMAYLFQKTNIQILPITRVQSLVDFWIFAEKQDLSILAYDISRNLIDNIEPSPELSEHGIDIAKAHISNNNFDLADKWIFFVENYQSGDSSITEKIHATKLLYDLKKSTDDDQFINILLDSDLLEQIDNSTIKQEILLTILSVIDKKNIEMIQGNRNLIDQRSMPSRYLIGKIKKSSETNNFGELLLSINISMSGKTWTETHPEHLRVILIALRDIQIEHIFKKIVLEILEESKII